MIIRFVLLLFVLGLTGCQQGQDASTAGDALQANAVLSDAELDNLVRRSYQYVAMYNVNNKFAMDPTNPAATGGWNRVKAKTALLDHTVQAIARPNNDTLYVTAMLDLAAGPMVLEMPAFDSKYVSFMVTAYDHYVNIPLSTRQGDFGEPVNVLLYSERTPGVPAEPVEGIDEVFQASGDFVSAVLRVMPHSAEPARMERNLQAMRSVRVSTLSAFLSGADEPGEAAAGAAGDWQFPAFGNTDFDVFENNLLEVMQFVLNHTSFDERNALDVALLAAYEPLGVRPGQAKPTPAVGLDGARVRAAAEAVAAEQLQKFNDPEWMKGNVTGLFQPRGEATLERLLLQSVVGPIGQPAQEAVYPAILAADGEPMNARRDYVIRMGPEALPPANAFWSLTLYDTENGFFLPNERKKYSVGENAGMQLNADGGIEIALAAEQPEGVPLENWLPMPRGDYGVDVVLRIYAPDLERYASWTVPLAEVLEPGSR